MSQTDIYDHLAGAGRPTMAIRQAARELGVSLGTIRRWCDTGLMTCARTPGGQRRFSIGDVERMRQEMWDRGSPVNRPAKGES